MGTAILYAARVETAHPVPADFPKDFPVYQNAAVKSYGPMIPSHPKLGNVLTLETTDSKAAVLAFYRKELPASGWTLATFPGVSDSLAASKGHRRISVSASESGAGAKRKTLIELGVNDPE